MRDRKSHRNERPAYPERPNKKRSNSAITHNTRVKFKSPTLFGGSNGASAISLWPERINAAIAWTLSRDE